MFNNEGSLVDALEASVWNGFWESAQGPLIRGAELGALVILLVVIGVLAVKALRWVGEVVYAFGIQLSCGGEDYQDRCEQKPEQ